MTISMSPTSKPNSKFVQENRIEKLGLLKDFLPLDGICIQPFSSSDDDDKRELVIIHDHLAETITRN